MNVFNTLIIFIILLKSKSIISWSNNYKFFVDVKTKCYCSNETVGLVLGVDYSTRQPYDQKSGTCGSTFNLIATTAWATQYDFVVLITHDKCTTHPTSKIRIYYECKYSYSGGYKYTCNEK